MEGAVAVGEKRWSRIQLMVALYMMQSGSLLWWLAPVAWPSSCVMMARTACCRVACTPAAGGRVTREPSNCAPLAGPLP